MFWLAIFLIVCLGTLYAYVTRPAALAARLRQKLAEVNLAVRDLGGVSFSLSDGLRIQDLELAFASDAPLATSDAVPPSPLQIQISSASVRINPWLLMIGRVMPREVVLDQPRISFVWAPRGPAGETNLFEFSSSATWPGPPVWLPRLEIRRAQIDVYHAAKDRNALRRRIVLDGMGRLLPATKSTPRTYLLRFEQAAGPAAPRSGAQDFVALRWSGCEVAAECDWMDLELEEGLLPVEWYQQCRALRLKGRLALREATLDARGLARLSLACADLGCAIPVEESAADPSRDCFAQLRDASASINYERDDAGIGAAPTALHGKLSARIEGRLNDAIIDADLDFQRLTLRSAPGAGDADATTAIFEPGPLKGTATVRNLTLPNLRENPHFVGSERLPEALRDWIRKYNAEGRVNLEVAFSDDGTLRSPTFAGRLESLSGSCRYMDFPYLISNARGAVRFSNDGIFFEGLYGRHGTSRIRVDGRLLNSESWTGFELNFRGHNVVSDADLYEALPPRYQTLWRRAAPVGLWDVAVRLERENGSEETGSEPTHVRVDAQLLGGSVRLQNDALLEDASGMLHIDSGRVEIENLFGYLDGALVCVNGVIRAGEADEPPDYDVHIEIADSPLEKTSLVRDRTGEVVGQIGFEGVGDIRAQLNAGRDARSQYSVEVKDGVLRGFDAEAPWLNARGWISLHEAAQEIHALDADRPGGALHLAGSVPAHFSVDAPVELDLSATDADMERLMRDLIPGRWSNIRTALGLTGGGSLAARFRPENAAENTPVRQAADVELRAEHMQPTPMPLDLRDVAALLTLRADGFEVREARANYGESGKLELRGHGGWSEGRLWTDVGLGGRDLDLNEDLIRALPAPLADFLKRLSPRGRMHLALDQLLMNRTQADEFRVVGRVELDAAQLNIGLPLENYRGQLSGTCEIQPEGRVQVDADFTLDEGTLAGRPMQRWEGHITRTADSPTVKLEDVRGRFCDGELFGFADVDLDVRNYALSFTLHDVSLDQFVRREESERRRSPGGRVDGNIFVRGKLDAFEDREGGGEIRIRGTSLLSSPVTAGVAQVGDDSKEGRRRADEARRREVGDQRHDVEEALLRFVWEGDELKFTRVDIRARDLRLVGYGSWNTRTDAIALTLVGASAVGAPRVLLLTDLLEAAGRELVQYRVEGTSAHPRVVAEPLHNLTEPLRGLLRGGNVR